MVQGQPVNAAQRSGVYFCRQAARCVTSVQGGDVGKHRFMVGTCALQQKNEIHLVEFAEETAEVTCLRTLPHEDEVWLMSVSPTDAQQVLTYSGGGGTGSAQLRLWNASMDGPTEKSAETSLQAACSLTDDEAPLATVKSALWDPHSEGSVLVADAESLRVFKGAGSGGASKFTRQTTLHVGQRCNGACMDPHHAQQVSTVDDAHLKTWDLRTSRVAFKKDAAHLFGARDVDYNPNVPYQVLTVGEDAMLRVWDLRNLGTNLRALSGGHHHWISKVRYNGHHDQLVLTCGTDSAVCLWRALSTASAPLGAGAGETASARPQPPSDGLIRRFDEHEDSCYSCCWSAADAWIFASVSYDGRLVVNRVPNEEKYRILL